MIDSEKVIKGLEETEIMLKQAVDRGGEMAVMGAFKCYNHVSDALALLKEQEAMMQCIKGKCSICPHCANCDVDENGLLKEQEAEWIEYPECLAYDGAYSDSHIVCSACKHVFSIMDNCTEEFDYCPHCGAKMEQEGR